MRVIVLSASHLDPANREKLRRLAGLGVDVIAAMPGGAAETDGLVRLVPIPVTGPADEPSLLRWDRKALRRLLSEHRPDLVQVEEAPESFLASAVTTMCHRLHLPVVLFSWTGPNRQAGLLERRRARRVLERVAGVIGGSRAAAESLAATARSEVLAMVLPQSGIELPPVVNRPEPDELSLGFVGRLVPERGFDRLVLALAQTYGRWNLTVLGTGPEQESLEALVQRHGLASRIRWLGGLRRESLDLWWRDLDCLVVPWREPPESADAHAPLLLEAMAHGVAPIVATTPPLPEIIGTAGILFDTEDDLTAALQQLVADPARTRLMGSRARARVLETYSSTAVATRTHEFWQAIVTERQAAPAIS